MLVIPGLYYMFGHLDGGRRGLKDEEDAPVSENLGDGDGDGAVEHGADEHGADEHGADEHGA